MRSVLMTALAVLFSSTLLQAAEPELTWLGHAGFRLTTSKGKVILIDPWLSSPKAPESLKLEKVDAILLTHAHNDHVGDAFELSKKHAAVIVAVPELLGIAESKGVEKTMPINVSGTQSVAGVTVTAVEAVHSSGYNDGSGVRLYGGVPVGYIIRDGDNPVVYHAGDTGVFTGMRLIGELYGPDIALLPMGGVYTMGPREAAKAASLLGVGTVVPMHFGTFPALTGTPEELKDNVRKGKGKPRIVELKLGKPTPLKTL